MTRNLEWRNMIILYVYTNMALPTLHPNQASFKLQVWISMVGTCQINSESEQAHSTASWQFFNQDQSGKVLVLAFDMHSKRHFTGRLRFHSQKETVKIGQALENPVIAVAQGTGWVNAVLICDDFPELGTNLVAALASQAREMCRYVHPHATTCLQLAWGYFRCVRERRHTSALCIRQKVMHQEKRRNVYLTSI